MLGSTQRSQVFKGKLSDFLFQIQSVKYFRMALLGMYLFIKATLKTHDFCPKTREQLWVKVCNFCEYSEYWNYIIIIKGQKWNHNCSAKLALASRDGRLTSLDASFMRCFGFFQTSSKTSRSMFFSKHRWNIASLSKKCDVFHDVLGFRKATQSRS